MICKTMFKKQINSVNARITSLLSGQAANVIEMTDFL